ncbi:MAG: hypothetical protein IM650_02475 [Phenylobacterium sp.]|uniref:hypothetical protein n=1 Tax=Phenylobacterium sp. TaxID=1871053 RepID=UPI0025CF1C4B|nr:hypothetical protein [Phenylobacterium sp.]MCA6256948.1 hypothetical protein [Phenylobacterium sp.]
MAAPIIPHVPRRAPSRADLINAIEEAEQFGDIGRGMSATLYTLADSLPDTVLQSFARRTLDAHRNMRAA